MTSDVNGTFALYIKGSGSFTYISNGATLTVFGSS
jgi:hypothetical protein